MAAVTGAIVALAGMGLSIGQAVKANNDKKKAEQAATVAANKMKNIKEVNQMSQVQVPTLGFDLAQQGIDRGAMAALSSAEGSGAEGVLGGAGNIMQNVKDAELGLAAQAGDLKLQRDIIEATQGNDIEARRAERERMTYASEIEGAQSAASQAQANKNAAIQSAVGSAGNALTSGSSAVSLYGKSNNGTKVKKNTFANTEKTVQPNYTGTVTGDYPEVPGLGNAAYLSAFNFN